MLLPESNEWMNVEDPGPIGPTFFLSFLFPFSNFWRLTDWPGAGLVSAYDP